MVLENCGKVSNDIDDAENQTILATNSDIASMCVPRDRIDVRLFREESVHLREGPDLARCCIYGEDEDENDDEENRGVSAGKKMLV